MLFQVSRGKLKANFTVLDSGPEDFTGSAVLCKIVKRQLASSPGASGHRKPLEAMTGRDIETALATMRVSVRVFGRKSRQSIPDGAID